MLKECFVVFQKLIDKYSDRIVLDNYVPKDGTYRLVEIQKDGFQIIDTVDIGYDRKSNEILGLGNEHYALICYLDYYSKLLEMNKPMDSSKTIHSNNYLSFAVKKEKLAEDILWEKSIDLYYDTFGDLYKKYSKPNARKLYAQVEEEYGEVDQELLKRIREWMKTRTFYQGIELNKKNYFKLFFIYPDEEETMRLYEREGNRYLLPNIYNSNDYNQEVNGEIYGLPNNNMGLNAKKPYIANRTRKISVPYLLNQKEVLQQTQFFDYLMGYASKDRLNIYVDLDQNKIEALAAGESLDRSMESGYFLRIRKGKEVEILKGEAFSNYSPMLDPAFYLEKCGGLGDNYKGEFIPGYGKKVKLKEMEQLIDDVFFEKKLHYNYFTEAGDMSNMDETLQNLLLISRDRLFSWLFLGQMQHVDGLLESISLKLIERSLQEGHFTKAKHQFNLRWSLMAYFSKQEGMVKKMEDVRSTLRQHLNTDEEWQFDTDEEYYYAVGQMAFYLINQSNAKSKPVSLIQPILNAKTPELMKQRLERLFEKYAHAIELSPKYKKVNRMYDHIVRYILKGKLVKKELIMAGTVADSLLYEKGVK